MKTKIIGPVCKIVVKDGKPYLTTPDGQILPKQVFTRVTQSLDEPAYAIVKILVNCVDT